jgi:hypothetical protein
VVFVLVGAPDQGVGCEIRISFGVHLTQSARTPNQLECFLHQPASTVRVAFTSAIKRRAMSSSLLSFILNLGQVDSRNNVSPLR